MYGSEIGINSNNETACFNSVPTHIQSSCSDRSKDATVSPHTYNCHIITLSHWPPPHPHSHTLLSTYPPHRQLSWHWYTHLHWHCSIHHTDSCHSTDTPTCTDIIPPTTQTAVMTLAHPPGLTSFHPPQTAVMSLAHPPALTFHPPHRQVSSHWQIHPYTHTAVQLPHTAVVIMHPHTQTRHHIHTCSVIMPKQE